MPGNSDRWDEHVRRYDPYGTNHEVERRLALQQLNGLLDRQRVMAKDQEYRDRQAGFRKKAEEREAERRATGMTEYEQTLSDRGLLNTDIGYDQEAHALGHPNGAVSRVRNHLKVRGKVDPATAAILRDAAQQGLIDNSQPWTNTAENRAALMALMEGKKADAMREQSRADAMAMEERKLQAQREMAKMQMDAQAAAEDRQFAHRRDLGQLEYDRGAEDRALQRQLMQAQVGATTADLKRKSDEYMTPMDKSALGQEQALAQAAINGDPEAYAALRRLVAGHPKTGMDPDVYRPSAAKVLAQPQIAQGLKGLHDYVRKNNWSISDADRQSILAKAQALIAQAGELGPDIKDQVKQRILDALNENGAIFEAAGSDATRRALGEL